MTAINASTGTSGPAPTPAQNNPDTDTPGAGGLQARKADGLPGMLGLYEVQLGGETRYMTADELEHAHESAGQGGAGGGPGNASPSPGTDRGKDHAPVVLLRDAPHHRAGGHQGNETKDGAGTKLADDVAWAQDFRKNADTKLKAAGIPADQRKRITDHLATLSGDALLKETRLLDHVLTTPNADRAVATYDELLTLSKQSTRAGERLTPALREELVRGVADPRTSTDKGLEGVLGKRGALEAARAVIEMPKSAYQRLEKTLDNAGQKDDGSPVRGADVHTERALILKAVGARAGLLKESALDVDAQKRHVLVSTPAGRAMAEVTGFAREVRGTKRQELIQKTSTLAINRVDRGPDVDKLPDGNTRSDVGLYQRYDAACGPTTSQNMRAERDPVFALKLRKEFDNPGNDSNLARQQKAELEKQVYFLDARGNPFAGTPAQVAKWRKDGTLPPGAAKPFLPQAFNRLGDQADQRLNTRLNDGWSIEHIPQDEYDAASKYMHNERTTPAEDALAKKAFDRLAKVDNGHPTATELDAMRSNYNRKPDGTSTKKDEHTWMYLSDALNDIAPPAAGKSWQVTVTNGGATNADGTIVGGMSNGDIATLDATLKAGSDVPIRICDKNNGSGHFMMISDVRGEGANKKYLVSDPWTGKTAWIKQADLQNFNSNWPNKQFSKDLASGVSEMWFER
jgi:hypothetical protein